jgi:tetratricopeptide (TPR) repeat protein
MRRFAAAPLMALLLAGAARAEEAPEEEPVEMAATERVDRARALILERDVESALILLDEALLADPDSLEARYLRGLCLDLLERHDEAVLVLRGVYEERLVAGPPGPLADARFRLALALGRGGRPEEALTLVESWPDPPEDPLDRARLAIATRCFQMAVRDDPEDGFALRDELSRLPAGALTWYAAWGEITIAQDIARIADGYVLAGGRAKLKRALAHRAGAIDGIERLTTEVARLQEPMWALEGLVVVSQARLAFGDAIRDAEIPDGASATYRRRVSDLAGRQWATAAEAADLGQTHAARLAVPERLKRALAAAKDAAEGRLASLSR